FGRCDPLFPSRERHQQRTLCSLVQIILAKRVRFVATEASWSWDLNGTSPRVGADLIGLDADCSLALVVRGDPPSFDEWEGHSTSPLPGGPKQKWYKIRPVQPIDYSKTRSQGGPTMTTLRINTVLQHLRRVVRPSEEAARTDGQLLESFVTRRDEPAF